MGNANGANRMAIAAMANVIKCERRGGVAGVQGGRSRQPLSACCTLGGEVVARYASHLCAPPPPPTPPHALPDSKDELLALSKQFQDTARKEKPEECIKRDQFHSCLQLVGIQETDREILDKLFTLYDKTGDDVINCRVRAWWRRGWRRPLDGRRGRPVVVRPQWLM